tara:strand:- start:1447 stop:2001 length:555 start_codon:yes stop_codon:yes gene_type:complete
MSNNKILFVDLDGTLIKEDLSYLAVIEYFKKKPFKLFFHLINFLFKGKPYLKEKVSKNYQVPFNKITFNKGVLDFVKNEKNRSRIVYLISGSHQILVDQIDDYLKIFFKSFGTKNQYNMVGLNKVKFINENLKIYNFDYLGNSKKDLPIWNHCKKILYTNVSINLREIIESSKFEKKEIKENFN